MGKLEESTLLPSDNHILTVLIYIVFFLSAFICRTFRNYSEKCFINNITEKNLH